MTSDEVIDEPIVQDAPPQEPVGQPDPPAKKLWNSLNKKQIYTKSYDDFQKQFSSPESVQKLHKALTEKELYTKGGTDFQSQFFPASTTAVKQNGTQISPAQPKPFDVLGAVGIPTMEQYEEQTRARHEKELTDANQNINKHLSESHNEAATLLKNNEAQADKDKFANYNAYGSGNFVPEPDKNFGIEPTVEQVNQVMAAPENHPAIIDLKAKSLEREGKKKDADKLRADAYLLSSAARDGNTAKQLDNAKKIKEGEVEYNPANDKLVKPVGFGESVHESWKKRNEDMDLFDLADNGTDAQLIAKLNSLQQVDPDEPELKPSGVSGTVGEFVGGQGKVSMEATAAQALNAIPVVGTAAAEAVAGGLYAHEFGRRGYATELQKSYNANKQAGLSDEDALKNAKSQAKTAMVTDAATAALMGATTGKAGSKVLQNTVKNAGKMATEGGWYHGVINNAFKHIGEETPAAIKNAGLAAAGEVAKNVSANMNGENRDVLEGSGTAAVNMAALHYTMSSAMAVLGKVANSAKPGAKVIQNKLLQGLGKLPIEDAKNIAIEQVKDGTISPQEAQGNIEAIEAHKEIDQQIPKEVTNDEVRLDLHKKIERRNELEEEAKTVNAAFKEPIKTKIEKLDEGINEIIKSPEAKEESPKQPRLKAGDGQEYADTPRMKKIIERGNEIRNNLPPVKDGDIRLWRGNREGEMGDNPSFTNSLEGIAIPFEEQYKGGLSYVDVPKSELSNYENKNGAAEGAEFILPKEISEKALPAEHSQSYAGVRNLKPKETNAVEEKVASTEMTGITHEQTNAIAEKLGYDAYQKDPEKVSDWDAQADKRISKDPDAISKLVTKMRNGDQPDAVEQRMMAKYVADLQAKVEKNPSKENLATLKRTIDLSNIVGGREVAKSLVARKGSRPVEETLGDYYVREMGSSKTEDLTEGQKQTVQKEYKTITESEKELNDKISKLEVENAKLKADRAVKKVVSETKKSKEHKDYVKERADEIQKMRASLLKVAKGGGGAMSSIPGAAQLAAIAPHVAKLVKSFVEEGVTELAEIVKKLHSTLKGVEGLEGITEKNAHDLIAGEYNERKQTRSQLSERLRDLKTQAQLINKLEKLKGEKEPTIEKKKVQRNAEIKKLQEEIKNYQKEHPDEEKQINTIKARTESELNRVQEKIDKGDYAPDEKKMPILENEEIRKRNQKIFDEALEAKDRLIKAKNDREVRLIKQQYANETRSQTFLRGAGEVLNMPRTLMSSMDFSAPFRQGLVGLIAHPKTGARAFSKMFVAAKSKKVFDRWFYDLHESKQFKVMQEAGLSITDPHNPTLAAKEEAFMNNLAQKIPIIGAGISGSERAYVMFLNKMRVDLFNKVATAFEANGKTIRNSPELYKELANHVNRITGRGTLGKAEILSPYLNSAFFSPRLIMSRVQLLSNFFNPQFYKKVPVQIRKMYFRDMAAFILAGAALLGATKIAHIGGLTNSDVELDPRSSDAFKIKSGDTRYDVLGGFQQYIRLIANIFPFIGGKKSTTTGEIKKLDGEGAFGEDRVDAVGHFLRGKLAPIPAMGLDLFSGQDMMGNKIVADQWFSRTNGFPYVTTDSKYKKEKTLLDEVGGNMFPLIISDVKDAFKQQGFAALGTVGIPAIFGVGTQTYSGDDKPKRPLTAEQKAAKKESHKKQVNNKNH